MSDCDDVTDPAGASVPVSGERVLGAIRIGSDGRFGLAFLECAHCQAPLVPARERALLGDALPLRAVFALSQEDYPRAALYWVGPGALLTSAADVLRAHVRVSPGCRRACIAWRVHGVKQLLRWERGVIAHVMEP